jgi:hypothetical protein
MPTAALRHTSPAPVAMGTVTAESFHSSALPAHLSFSDLHTCSGPQLALEGTDPSLQQVERASEAPRTCTQGLSLSHAGMLDGVWLEGTQQRSRRLAGSSEFENTGSEWLKHKLCNGSATGLDMAPGTPGSTGQHAHTCTGHFPHRSIRTRCGPRHTRKAWCLKGLSLRRWS